LEARRPVRFGRLERDEFDVIVIGAGLGGLTAAAILSRRGVHVLVLDRHYVAGGNATVFHRPGYEFDVGLHYLGDCGKDGVIPGVLAEAGVPDVEFLEYDPDGFDTLCFPDGYEFRYPRGLDRFQARLLAEFPGEARGIRRYCRLLRGVHLLGRASGYPLRMLGALPRSLLALRNLRTTLAEFLDTCTSNPRLRAVLVGPHLDYAVAASRVSVVLHAGLVMHYLSSGAYYPRGGGQVIADRLAAGIERNGGRILLRTTVERIVVERGRVQGVVYRSGSAGECSARAPLVVSNADIKKTFLELLPREALRPATVSRVSGFEMAPGLGVVYLGARADGLPPGLRRTNFWVFPGDDVEQDYREVAAGRFSETPTTYVTIASLKDPGHLGLAPEGVVNLQLMTVVPSGPAAWGVDEAQLADGSYRREPAYVAAKERLAERLLARAETVLPGLRAAVVFREVATPLTQVRYTRASNGTAYGIACTPEQFLGRRPAATTEIAGLVLAGASARSGHGIVGACSSGREAAHVAWRALARLGHRPAFEPLVEPVVVPVAAG
jgi:phytoene dehydrogenase-like protein